MALQENHEIAGSDGSYNLHWKKIVKWEKST